MMRTNERGLRVSAAIIAASGIATGALAVDTVHDELTRDDKAVERLSEYKQQDTIQDGYVVIKSDELTTPNELAGRVVEEGVNPYDGLITEIDAQANQDGVPGVQPGEDLVLKDTDVSEAAEAQLAPTDISGIIDHDPTKVGVQQVQPNTQQ